MTSVMNNVDNNH